MRPAQKSSVKGAPGEGHSQRRCRLGLRRKRQPEQAVGSCGARRLMRWIRGRTRARLLPSRPPWLAADYWRSDAHDPVQELSRTRRVIPTNPPKHWRRETRRMGVPPAVRGERASRARGQSRNRAELLSLRRPASCARGQSRNRAELVLSPHAPRSSAFAVQQAAHAPKARAMAGGGVPAQTMPRQVARLERLGAHLLAGFRSEIALTERTIFVDRFAEQADSSKLACVRMPACRASAALGHAIGSSPDFAADLVHETRSWRLCGARKSACYGERCQRTAQGEAHESARMPSSWRACPRLSKPSATPWPT